MQFMMVPVLIAGLIALLRGGQWKNLACLSLKHAWIPLAMLTLQFGIVLFPLRMNDLFLDLGSWITVATYGLLILFLGVNRRLPGVKLILVGTALNLTVILTNGGHMPVTPEALARSGHLDKVYLHEDQAYVLGSKDIVLPKEQTHLLVLSDVLKVPGAIEVPATFSIGDVLIMIGAAWLAYRSMLSNPVGRTKANLAAGSHSSHHL
jgi:multisubunit Na+/H+ antiporter MnhG subunit